MDRRIRGMIMGKTVRLFFGFLTIVFSVHRADAANLDVTPSILLGASWDSNIFNTESNEQTDYVFRGAPRLTFTVSSPTVRMDLTGAVEGEKYADHDELDEAAATKTVEFRLTRRGPRATISPSARFVETNDVTRRDIFSLEAAPVPDPGAVPTESLIAERVRTQVLTGALQVAYLLTPNVTVGIGGGAMKREFAENVSGFAGSRTVTGNATLTYSLTPRTSGGVYFDTSYNSFDGSPNSRTYTGGLRGTHRATEYTTLSASAGATLLREHVGKGDDTDDDWSPTGSVSVAYAKQDFRATLLGSYVIAGGGSFGETTERGTVALTLSDSISPRWSWNLGGSYQTNRSTDDRTATVENVDFATGAAGLRWQVVSWASIGLSGNIYRQRSDTPLGRDIDRETAFLDLTLANTYRPF